MYFAIQHVNLILYSAEMNMFKHFPSVYTHIFVKENLDALNNLCDQISHINVLSV